VVTLEEIERARARLNQVVCRTPLVPFYDAGGERLAWLKPENFQPVGSFKLRGAYNRMAALDESERARGVVAFSTGNHAQGVAYAGRRLGIKATIVMPRNAPAVKVDATRRYGAEVVLFDPAQETHEEVVQKLLRERGAVYIHPSDDPYVIAGQGTIGLEIFEDLPEVDLVLIPVGGGGLLSGVAASLKRLTPRVRIVGVEPELAADARASLKSGRIVEWSAADTGRTIADGVRNSRVGELAFAHMQEYVSDIVAVSEDEIRAATRHLLLKSKLVVEPSAALPVAAYLFHGEALPESSNAVMILTGGNIDPALLREMISE
jgi:threo-3-hydroxy-L-aspartate ammonia-lyase